MGLIPTHLIDNSKKYIDLTARRQEALSDNLVNIHTKGYHRKDVDFSQYLTNGTSSTFENKLIDKFGTSPVSNQVSQDEVVNVEEELSKMQENYLMYNVAVRQLSSTITEIKTALNVSANG